VLHEAASFPTVSIQKRNGNKAKRKTIMKLRKSTIGLLLVGAAALAATTLALAAPRAPRKSAGQCGEYSYWHNGKCEDARIRKSEKNWSDEALSKQWKP
jgi:hypothetical protein